MNIKIPILVLLLALTTNINALNLELRGGFSHDWEGKYTPDYYTQNKNIVDVGLYLVHPVSRDIEILCGVYHATNPAEDDKRAGSGIEGVRCGVGLILLRF